MGDLLSLEVLTAFITLASLEIILGIDNVIFISILADKLPANQRDRARITGLSLAMFMRIAMLFSLTWIIGLTGTLFTVADFDVSGRDVILLLGGLFLIYKATTEIHSKLEGDDEHHETRRVTSFRSVIIQILLLDIVFSLDSVITAVGMTENLAVMITAVVFAVLVMLFASGPLSNFVSQHPTVKMLALAFLILIGTSLVAEGLHQHVPKGYIYFAMGFSVLVEALNFRLRSRNERSLVQLHRSRINEDVARTIGAVD